MEPKLAGFPRTPLLGDWKASVVVLLNGCAAAFVVLGATGVFALSAGHARGWAHLETAGLLHQLLAAATTFPLVIATVGLALRRRRDERWPLLASVAALVLAEIVWWVFFVSYVPHIDPGPC